MTSTAARRRERNRSEIARVAITLFAARGFDAVTVDDIAEAADISQRTFFRYFATKDEVVLDYERQLQHRLVRALEARPAKEGAVAALREAFRETSHVEPDDRARVVEIGRILDDAPGLRLPDGRALEDAVGRRLGTDGTDPRARVVVTAMGAVAAREFRAWAVEGGTDNPAERITAALALLERGLKQLDRAR